MAKFFSISPFSFDNVDFFEFLEQYDLMENYLSQNNSGNSIQNLLGE